jgi:hypothetical protein
MVIVIVFHVWSALVKLIRKYLGKIPNTTFYQNWLRSFGDKPCKEMA